MSINAPKPQSDRFSVDGVPGCAVFSRRPALLVGAFAGPCCRSADPGSWLVSFLGLFVLCEDLFEAFGGWHCSVVTKAVRACRQAVDDLAAISVELRQDSDVLGVLGDHAQGALDGPVHLRYGRSGGVYDRHVPTPVLR